MTKIIYVHMYMDIGRRAYIYPFNRVQMINQYYDYSVSVTVFTSILKFCKLLRFSASDDF